MKFFKNKLFISIGFAILVIAIVLVIGVPKILNSETAIRKYEQILSQKTGTEVVLEGFKFYLHKDLTIGVKIKKLSSKDKAQNFVDFEDVDYRSLRFSLKPAKLNIASIYLDFDKLKPRLKEGKNTKKTSLRIDYLPVINVKNALIRFDNESSMQFVNVHSEKIDGTVYCAFVGILNVPFSNDPIIIGEDGFLYFTKQVNFEDFSLRYKNSKLTMMGSIDNLNFDGKDLSVYDLENFFVFFYKTKHNGKRNFIENFENFKGTLDVHLALNSSGLHGKCRANNLQADFSKYKIPVALPVVDFNFNGRKMNAVANGTFGFDPVQTEVLVEGIATDNVVVTGSVKSPLSDKFTKKYFKPIQIKGFAEAEVKYLTQNGKVNVDYSLGIPVGSDLITSYGSLSNVEKYRKITASTVKNAQVLELSKYDYLFSDTAGTKGLLTGEGLFKQQNSHLSPEFITLKTVGNIPIPVFQSFVQDYITDGAVEADLRYDFLKNEVDGNVKLYDTHHADFMLVNKADINFLKDKITAIIDGQFFNSPIKMSVSALNEFSKKIVIQDIDINLDKYHVKRGNLSTVKSAFKSSSVTPKKDLNIVVNRGKIRVGEIINPKFYLKDVEIFGLLKDNIVDFVIPQTQYSSGLLSAKGQYNIKNHSSDIHFFASDINSNEVATKIFNLPNQFEGIGFATLHMKTANKLNDIHANATFAITDGFLPKLGSREIMVNASSNKKSPVFFLKKSFKFTLSKITNIDFSKPNVFYSNLRGSFVLDNSSVHNVKIFSQSDYLSMFVEGKYDIADQVGDLTIWGRHNKVAEKKIKIFKIPLSLIYKVLFKVERSKNAYIDKIDQIPPVKATPSEMGIFRVLVNGNLNNDDINVKLKDIR